MAIFGLNKFVKTIKQYTANTVTASVVIKTTKFCASSLYLRLKLKVPFFQKDKTPHQKA